MSRRSHSSLALNVDVLGSFQPAKSLLFHEDASITSLDFDISGQYLVSAGVDKSIQLYDFHKGVRHKDIQLQKYGAHLARFTNNELNCLYASTPVIHEEADHSIRYLSLATKSYLRYFKGHKDQVLALEVNPVTDMFLSASADHTVKTWDLRTSQPAGNISVGGVACVAYDPHGIVFAVAVGHSVSLYDASNYERGAFAVADIPSSNKERYTKLEFSNNGRYVLVATDSSQHYLLDAFLGKLVARLSVTPERHEAWLGFDYAAAGSACFTPDGKFVLAGSPQGYVAIFDLAGVKTIGADKTLRPQRKMDSALGPSKLLAFNPKLLSFASADNRVILWAPTIEED